MKTYLLGLLLALFLTACVSTSSSPHTQAAGNSWQLVYANDKDGNAVEGSKELLMISIRAGKPVRIYTAGRRVEHASELQFLTIFEGEVFGQITPIEAQSPDTNPTRMLFRQPGIKWRSIVGTNGFVTAFMDGGEPNIRKGSTKWFVQQ